MTPDLIEKMARAVRDARALPGTKPVARLSDVDRRAAAALAVALDEIGEECAMVAAEAWWSHESEYTPTLIRARIAEMKADLDASSGPCDS